MASNAISISGEEVQPDIITAADLRKAYNARMKTFRAARLAQDLARNLEHRLFLGARIQPRSKFGYDLHRNWVFEK